MSSSGNEDDPAFLALPARLRQRIDSAFDSVAPQSTHGASAEAGSFIVGGSTSQSAEYEAGGFIVEDLPLNSAQTHILLSEIPGALSLLELSPDDDIMGVFKNAATGWGAQNARNDGVSRKDWRAVCAALLEGELVDEEDPAVDEDAEMDTDSGPDSDEYRVDEQSSDTEEPSSDEYEEPDQTTAKGKKAQKAAQRTPTKSSGTDIPRQLTESQKAQCRRDFGRFFPQVPDVELDHQRIMIKDIARVADLLKENLKTEEILEMLEAFSTRGDKSISLTDFEYMMIVTKLV